MQVPVGRSSGIIEEMAPLAKRPTPACFGIPSQPPMGLPEGLLQDQVGMEGERS